MQNTDSNWIFSLWQEGKRGYLEGLAAHYSKEVNMPYEDVLDAIECARSAKWRERHMRMAASGNSGNTGTLRRGNSSGASGSFGMGVSAMITGNIANQAILPSSHSQPLYVPGKYSVRHRIKLKLKLKLNFHFLSPNSLPVVYLIERRMKSIVMPKMSWLIVWHVVSLIANHRWIWAVACNTAIQEHGLISFMNSPQQVILRL